MKKSGPGQFDFIYKVHEQYIFMFSPERARFKQ